MSTIVRAVCIAASVLIPVSAAAQSAPPAAAPRPSAVVHDQTIRSLHRAHPSWQVVTRITLAAESTSDSPLSIEHTNPRHGTLQCAPAPAGRSATLCTYEPAAKFAGRDTFDYWAVQGQTTSDVARVTIDVESSGLQWELETTAATLRGDSGGTAVPGVASTTMPDAVFSLNWQIARPRSRVKVGQDTSNAAITSQAIRGTLDYVTDRSPTRSVNFVVRTGLVSPPVATEVVPVNSPSPAPAPVPGSGPTTAVARRQVLAETEVNANLVTGFSGTGSFAEFGAVLSGAVHAPVEGDGGLLKIAEQVYQIASSQQATFKFATGFRFAVKQYTENESSTEVMVPEEQGGVTTIQSYRPSDSEDLVVVELTAGRDSGLKGLSELGNRSQNRWALRFSAFPRIPYVAGGTQRFAFAVEVTRAFSGGPKVVRLLYGVNLSNVLGR